MLSQGLNITVVLEYAPGKVILGLDEPGYLLADKNLIAVNDQSESAA